MPRKPQIKVAELPVAGSLSPELAALIHQNWIDAVISSGRSLAAFDSNSSLDERLKWANMNEWLVGGALSRFSTKLQCSTVSQLVECVRFAARNNIYIAPELCCCDEGVSGRKVRRDGLDRMKAILGAKLIDVLLVFKVSRILRSAHKSFAFIQENVVEEGIRAISVSQGIDTTNETSWKALLYMHGILDELLLGTIADHVYAGQVNLFREGWTTGAIPVGYQRKELPDARPTKLGKVRTAVEVNPDHVALLIKHFEYHRDGMSFQRGWQLWVAAGGPCDPRSTTGRMSYNSYRRMFRNQRFIGLWAFGRMKNVWKSKCDYTAQEPRPESDVIVVRCEQLRIVSDELFFAVQAVIAKRKRGAPGPKRQDLRNDLWDWVADIFICSACRERFYHYGSGGGTMRCKNGAICPQKTSLRREEVTRIIIAKLQELLSQDVGLISQTILRAQALDSQPDPDLQQKIQLLARDIATESRKIRNQAELLGTENENEAKELKEAISAAQLRRSQLQGELSLLEARLNRQQKPISGEQIQAVLNELEALLLDAAAGRLGVDGVGKAVALFKLMVGGSIEVHAESRPGRKRPVVRATFTPQLILATADRLSALVPTGTAHQPVEVWLRPPPECDRLAIRVHELVDGQSLSYREAADVINVGEGRRLSAVRISVLYGRYYELISQPRPRHSYNRGRPRKSKRS